MQSLSSKGHFALESVHHFVNTNNYSTFFNNIFNPILVRLFGLHQNRTWRNLKSHTKKKIKKIDDNKLSLKPYLINH